MTSPQRETERRRSITRAGVSHAAAGNPQRRSRRSIVGAYGLEGTHPRPSKDNAWGAELANALRKHAWGQSRLKTREPEAAAAGSHTSTGTLEASDEETEQVWLTARPRARWPAKRPTRHLRQGKTPKETGRQTAAPLLGRRTTQRSRFLGEDRLRRHTGPDDQVPLPARLTLPNTGPADAKAGKIRRFPSPPAPWRERSSSHNRGIKSPYSSLKFATIR